MYTRGRMEGKEGWVRDVYEGKEGRKGRMAEGCIRGKGRKEGRKDRKEG